MTGLSAIIPTYGREAVLLDTIAYLRLLDPAPAEILVIDQTLRHLPQTEEALSALEAQCVIRHIRLATPSIPRAMNRGLLEARSDIVLFLDDDIIPAPSLVAAHLAAHSAPDRLVAGRVIQPWQEGMDFSGHSAFHFASMRAAVVSQFMGGNFSLRRADALALGGFDENFVRVAYQFEAEFSYRWRKAGRTIIFEPQACIHHLKAAAGGTRSFGEHLTTWLPAHSVGAYYYLLRTWRGGSSAWAFAARPVKAIMTRYHLRRPWRIPATLVSEALGVIWALHLAAQGPALIDRRPRRADV